MQEMPIISWKQLSANSEYDGLILAIDSFCNQRIKITLAEVFELSKYNK
jgi:hypothetical protein